MMESISHLQQVSAPRAVTIWPFQTGTTRERHPIALRRIKKSHVNAGTNHSCTNNQATGISGRPVSGNKDQQFNGGPVIELVIPKTCTPVELESANTNMITGSPKSC